MIDEALVDLEPLVTTKVACRLVGRSRATLYRHRQDPKTGPPAPRPIPPNALSDDERAEVLAVRQRTHPAKKKPELIARQPNEVWSWDITKLQGPQRGVHYELLVIIDIFSRYVVGWMVAPAESGELAEAFIADATATQGIVRDQLTIHADRGSSMTSKPVAQLLLDLGVARTHSRPHVSNDSPYSESNFKTLKYCPAFPGRFGSIEDARALCAEFFNHYNHVHRQGGIGLHTAASVHYGTAAEIRTRRAEVLDAAYAANPGRFGHRRPAPPKLPTVAWINEPTPEALIKSN